MYGVSTEFNRSSEDIPWYLDGNLELKGQFGDFLNNHSDLITHFNVDNLGTQQVTFIVYANEEVFNQFMLLLNEAFPTFFEDRDAYCLANNISITRTVDPDV